MLFFERTNRDQDVLLRHFESSRKESLDVGLFACLAETGNLSQMSVKGIFYV